MLDQLLDGHKLAFGFVDHAVPRLIVVPLSSQEVDGVRKEKERLTAGQERAADRDASDTSISYPSPVGSQNTKPIICY